MGARMGVNHDNSSAARGRRRQSQAKGRWNVAKPRRRIVLPCGSAAVEVDRDGRFSLIEMRDGTTKRYRSSDVVYCDS